MADFTLRLMEPADAAAVAALILAAFAAQSVVTDPPPSALRVTEADVVGHPRSGGGGPVAEADCGLIGSTLWSEPDGGLYLPRPAVGAASRCRGVDKALVGAAEAAARAMRLPRVRLARVWRCLTTAACSPPAGYRNDARGPSRL